MLFRSHAHADHQHRVGTFRREARGHHFQEAQFRVRPTQTDRHVPVPGADGHPLCGDREASGKEGSYHHHARREENHRGTGEERRTQE